MRNTIPILLLWLILSPVLAQQRSITKGDAPEELKVVESPPPAEESSAGTFSTNLPSLPRPDLVYRLGQPALAGIHRGGEIHSYTLPEQYDLVDHSAAKGQEGASSPARLGALIYGEIINPDSLGILTLEFSTGLLPLGQALHDSTIQVPLVHGTFFDGILDPRVQKFQTYIPISDDFATLSLKIGERSLLRDILIFPGDSIKVGIDLQDFSLVFAGPQANWFEAQYAMHRAWKANHFSKARVLLENDREQLLEQNDNRFQIEQQEYVFGSRIAIYEFGKDGLDHELSILMDSSLRSIPGWHALQKFQKLIPEDRFQLLESQLIGSYYAAHLATLRQYHHGMPLALGDTLSALRAKKLLPAILSKLDKLLNASLEKGPSPGAMEMAREWSYTEKIIRNEPLEELITSKYNSPIKEILLYSALLQDVGTKQLSPEAWMVYADYLEESTFEQEFNRLKSTLEPGNFLIPARFYNLNGEQLPLKEFYGKPTLLYFYFSTCTHSANYFRNYLQPFYRKMGESLGLQVVAVSVDNDSDLWKSQLSTFSSREILNLNLPHEEAADWLNQYTVSGYPRTMLLDKEGKVLSYLLTGKDYSEYSSNILSLLENQQTHENQLKH